MQDDRLPWLPYLVITFLEGFLEPHMKVFEWGSGDSTYWIAERVKEVVTVDHDEEWFGQVKTIENVTAHLARPEPGAIRQDKADPSAYYSECLGDVNLKSYVSVIDTYSDFHLILVDGRSRASCLAHSISHVLPGGCVVLDNSERLYYTERTVHLFDSWDRMDINGHGPHLNYQWRTIVWRKP